jgi:hypothetical protein
MNGLEMLRDGTRRTEPPATLALQPRRPQMRRGHLAGRVHNTTLVMAW